MKREASKSRDNIIIKATQAAQEKSLSHLPSQTTPTMGFLPSSLKHRLEANNFRHQILQNVSPNPSNAATINRMVRFLRAAT
jgi:hypothetical protein